MICCNTRSHGIDQLHEDGTSQRRTEDCDQQGTWRVLSELPLCVKLFKFIKLIQFEFIQFKFKFEFEFIKLVKFFKFTKSIRAAIFVFILCPLFFSFITFIFLILVLLFIFLIFVVVLLLLVLLLFLLFLIFIFIVLFVLFKKPQQIRPTSVLFWLEPKLESELRNAGVELATELSSLQYGMARYCFFHF